MGWKDFFYFSKGERRALTLLLCILSLILLLLVVKEHYLPEVKETPAAEVPGPFAKDSASSVMREEQEQESPKPSPKEKFTPKPRFTKSAPTFAQKFPRGTIIELNTADTLILKKVPGIGSVFANRIVKYRNLLGGYFSAEQLREVYGIDEEKFTALLPWFEADAGTIRKLRVNLLPTDSLSRHPYLSYKQAKAIAGLKDRKGKLSGWEAFSLLEEFTEADKSRLSPYISFE